MKPWPSSASKGLRTVFVLAAIVGLIGTAAPAPSATASAAERKLRTDRPELPETTLPAAQATEPDAADPPGRPLSGPDPRPALTIASEYLRRHRSRFGAVRSGNARRGRVEVFVSPNGTRHLLWRPTIGGIPIAGDGLRIHVANDGRILAVHGAPAELRHLLEGKGIQPPFASVETEPEVGLRRAVATAFRVAGRRGKLPPALPGRRGKECHTKFTDGSEAELAFVAGRDGPRLAWRVLTADTPGIGAWATLVAADDGTVLHRRPLTRAFSGRGRVWDARPTDPRMWTSFPDRWITTGTALRGDFAHAFADVLEEGQPLTDPEGNGGEVPASGSGPGGLPEWDESHTTSGTANDPETNPLGGIGCSALFPCSWSSFVPYSWAANLRQATLQAFYFANRFHDHLEAPPIGFDRASGNFETDTPGGTDGDPVRVSTFVGASSDGGLPHSSTMNNGRMTVFPEGRSPELRLYLFGGQAGFPVVDGNPAEIAAVVYHEYTHGMLGRLVTDASGINAMNIIQAGALYEGLADFYALDYLEATGAVTDSPVTPGELLAGEELTGGMTGMRHSAVDCPVGVKGAERCPSSGGFTFADLATIARMDGEPTFEYHADGEIMTQTAWDLRSGLIAVHGREEGIRRTRELVSEALRLLAPEPSYLEFRDGILLADAAVGSRDRNLIWQVFAKRGMGVHAEGSVTSTRPLADFTVPGPTVSDPDDPADPDDRVRSDTSRKARPKVVVKMPRRSLRALGMKRGLPVRIKSNQPLRVRATLSVPAREARRRGLRRRARTVKLARIRARSDRAGRSTLRLKARPRLRRKLKPIPTLRVRLVMRIVDSERRVTRKRVTLRLRG